jgi:hypothetical protein
MFEKYWQEKEAYDAAHLKEMCRVIPMNSPTFNQSVFVQTIDSIPQMNDVDLRKFIQQHFNSIMHNTFFSQDSTRYVLLFRDIRFLDAFIDVLIRMQYFEKDTVIECNTICYHYITLSNSDKDPHVLSRMIRISNIINRSGLPHLLGLGLGENLASMLLIARYSDLDLNICVKRVDFIIITQPKELMNQKMITEVFKSLFNPMEEFPRIFPYFMLDVLPDYNENNPNTLWVTDEIDEVNSVMNLAILDILDNLPSQLIRNTLVNYAEGYRIVNSNKRVRFSMQRLSDDYYRINDVVNALAERELIFVP